MYVPCEEKYTSTNAFITKLKVLYLHALYVYILAEIFIKKTTSEVNRKQSINILCTWQMAIVLVSTPSSICFL